MKKRQSPSHLMLIGLAVLSIIIFALVENSKTVEKKRYFTKKKEAVKIAEHAQTTLKKHLFERGLPIDKENDPGETGLIGQQYTLVTTDTGKLSAKLASTNVDFAAAFVDMFSEAGLKRGDVVAIGQTGSFPALNINMYAAIKALELDPIIITSVGASSWGANNPDFSWLDMETLLVQKNIFNFRSSAVSIGGGGDRGRGLSPKGRQLIVDSIERNIDIGSYSPPLYVINPNSLRESIDRRLDWYAQLEAEKSKQIKCYVNVGGGIASLGSTQNRILLRGGLSPDLYKVHFPVEGVITHMAERGLPIIHMLHIERIARKFGISPMPYAEPETIGQGPLYYREVYQLGTTIAMTLFLILIIVLFLRIDVKHYLFRKNMAPPIH